MVYAQHRICPGEWHTQIPMEFCSTYGSPIIGQMTRPTNNQQQKKRTCRIVDFAVLANHKAKFKESEKKDNSVNLAWELKKLWNMKVIIIPIVIGAFSTVTEGLVQGQVDLEITERVEAIQTIVLLRSAEILRRVLETCELLSLKL